MKLSLVFCILVFFNAKTFAQYEGDSIFNSDQVHEVYLTFNQISYWDSLTAYFQTDQYLMADMIVDGVAYPSVGVKFKGNSSYNNSSRKKSFKIDLNEYVSGQDINGLKKFNLNNGFKDPSFLREKMACDFYFEHGLDAPRCTYAKVYLNGVYWGLYNFIEEVDTKQFLNRHYLYHDGNIFKGDPTGDLRYINSQPSTYYTKYELHNNDSINDWSDLVELITKINNSGANFRDSLESILNTETFIDQWAALNLFVNLDSYLGSGHNYFIYHDTNLDKFEWIGWDLNESFGTFRMNLSSTALKNLSLFYVPSPANSRPLINNMQSDPVYRQLLIDKACEWIQYDFSNAALDRKVDSIANVIRPFVYADTNKFYSNQNFETNLFNDVTVQGGSVIFGIKSFIAERRNSLMAELAPLGCFISKTDFALETDQLSIFPNPAHSVLTISMKGNSQLNRIIIYNSIGEIVLQKSVESEEIEVDCSMLSAGLYLVSLNDKDKKRLVIE